MTAPTSEAEYLRTVLPVVADYVRQLAAGADLDRLKRAAQHAEAVHELAVIQALIVARDAVKRAAEAVPVPKPFTVLEVGLCRAAVCTSLTNDDATTRLNTEHPTGISSRWELANGPLPDGGGNGQPCGNHPSTHRHLLFHC